MWLLYVEQPDMAGELRDILAAPVARATVDINDDTNDFLRVNTVGWQIRAPSRRKLMVGLESGETMVDTFQVTLGVPMDVHKHLPTQQPKTITISRDSGDFSLLDRDITGLYEHCPDCATSLDCLYKRVSTSSFVDESAEDNGRPMFFFHDPERTGLAENDSFVFADNCDRLDYMQNRNEFVKLKAGGYGFGSAITTKRPHLTPRITSSTSITNLTRGTPDVEAEHKTARVRQRIWGVGGSHLPHYRADGGARRRPCQHDPALGGHPSWPLA